MKNADFVYNIYPKLNIFRDHVTCNLFFLFVMVSIEHTLQSSPLALSSLDAIWPTANKQKRTFGKSVISLLS